VGVAQSSTAQRAQGAGASQQVIELRLAHIQELFELPQSDLFSEYRNFLTGVDYCISELRSRRSRAPVLLIIRLPEAELEDDLAPRVARTLQRYCDHRTHYNGRERRALRMDGISALRIGVPITAFGLLLTQLAGGELVGDHLGWVLAWIGLWFPLDQFFFYPLAGGRENRVLTLLRNAEIVIEPHRAPPVGAPPLVEGSRF
jgi:hypothetical protein